MDSLFKMTTTDTIEKMAEAWVRAVKKAEEKIKTEESQQKKKDEEQKKKDEEVEKEKIKKKILHSMKKRGIENSRYSYDLKLSSGCKMRCSDELWDFIMKSTQEITYWNLNAPSGVCNNGMGPDFIQFTNVLTNNNPPSLLLLTNTFSKVASRIKHLILHYISINHLADASPIMKCPVNPVLKKLFNLLDAEVMIDLSNIDQLILSHFKWDNDKRWNTSSLDKNGNLQVIPLPSV